MTPKEYPSYSKAEKARREYEEFKYKWNIAAGVVVLLGVLSVCLFILGIWVHDKFAMTGGVIVGVFVISAVGLGFNHDILTQKELRWKNLED